MWRDFKAFLLKQNVIALAIAVVVGAALNQLVTAVVDDFIMPVVGAALPAGAWREWTANVGSVAFRLGHFLSVLLNFLIVGLVAWRISRIFIKPEPPSAKPATKNCPYCRMDIDAQASRCAHCTSQLAAVA